MMLITGATGFIGRDLCRELAKHDNLRIITRQEITSRAFPFASEIVRGSVSDAAVVDAAAKGVDVIYHLAAEGDHFAPWQKHYLTTVKGTENVMRAALKHSVKKVVYMSSAAVKVPIMTNYVRAKKEAEAIALKYGKKLDVPILRAALVYDSRVAQKLKRLFMLPFPYKKQEIHLTYKRSLVEALVDAGKRGKSEVYEVGDKEPTILTKLRSEVLHKIGFPSFFVLPPQVIYAGVACAYPIYWASRLFRIRPFITPDFIRYTFYDRELDTHSAEEALRYTQVDTIKEFKALV